MSNESGGNYRRMEWKKATGWCRLHENVSQLMKFYQETWFEFKTQN